MQQYDSGVDVEGPARLTTCVCNDAPIALQVDRARLDADGDLELHGATLKAGSVPLAWTPWLLLRPRDRVGLLPARLGFSSEEGARLGSGLHMPAGDTFVDWTLDGYSRGGGASSLTWTTPGSRTRATWDYLDDHALTLDARGSRDTSLASSVAWDVDAIRGERGVRATPLWSVAAQVFDRARVAASAAGTAFSGGLDVSWDDYRGGSLIEDGSWPSTAHVGLGTELGFSSELAAGLGYEARVGLSSHAIDGQAVQHLVQEAGLGADTSWGPTWLGVRGGWAGHGLLAPDAHEFAVQQHADVRWSLPLWRSWPNPKSASRPGLTHWLEPFVSGRGFRVASQRVDDHQALDQVSLPLLDGLAGNTGVRSAWTFATGELDLESGVGVAAPSGSEAVLGGYARVLGWHLLGAGSELAWSSDVAWVPERHSVVNLSRVAVSHASGASLTAGVEGQRGAEAAEARQFWSPEIRRSGWPWFASSTWSASADVVVPLSAWLASHAGTVVDVNRARSLAHHGGLGYRHSCGCLALAATVSERVGREGFDAWLSLDLLSR